MENDKKNPVTINFFETTQMNGSNYVKLPLRSSLILIIQNDDKYCFIRSILANIHLVADSKNGHPTRVSNYRQNINKKNIQNFEFTEGSKCSDVHKSEKLKKLAVNIFELRIHPDQ